MANSRHRASSASAFRPSASSTAISARSQGSGGDAGIAVAFVGLGAGRRSGGFQRSPRVLRPPATANRRRSPLRPQAWSDHRPAPRSTTRPDRRSDPPACAASSAARPVGRGRPAVRSCNSRRASSGLSAPAPRPTFHDARRTAASAARPRPAQPAASTPPLTPSTAKSSSTPSSKTVNVIISPLRSDTRVRSGTYRSNPGHTSRSGRQTGVQRRRPLESTAGSPSSVSRPGRLRHDT